MPDQRGAAAGDRLPASGAAPGAGRGRLPALPVWPRAAGRGHLLNGVSEPVLERAFQYWRNVDKHLGDRIESGVRASK